MNIDPTPRNRHTRRLQNKVVLIINGLSESGRLLAKMLSKQGADVAIVGSKKEPELSREIRRDVEANGRRCLLLTPNSTTENKPEAFTQLAIEKIVKVLGRLDVFISYSAPDSADIPPKQSAQREVAPQSLFFDQRGMAKAALKYILSH